MTKEQLLASLKPLEWTEEPERVCLAYYTRGGWWSNLISGPKHEVIIRYAIYQTEKGYVVQSIAGIGMERSYLAYGNTLAEAQSAAQEHYNNLVLQLFNLEDK